MPVTKVQLREQIVRRRDEQGDKDALSRSICETFAAQTEYAEAETVLLYVGVRSEVRTQLFLTQAIEQGKRVLVPFCAGRDLSLFRLERLGELEQGPFGLLEPGPHLREQPNRIVDIRDVDLVMAPGIAFDRRGGRLGHGKGYYDRLLSGARAETLVVGVAFECQILPEVPMMPHDVFMDRVITEQGGITQCLG